MTQRGPVRFAPGELLMLRSMWLFPALAAAVALVFSTLLVRRFLATRRSYLAFWAIALGMYAMASGVVALGALDGWTPSEFRVYWAVGAVLNVPFLAQGEVDLLVRNKAVRSVLYVALVFVTAYTIARVRTAAIDEDALTEDLPSGKEVFGDGTPAHRLPQLVAIPAYGVLVGGALWSAWRMRGRPDLRDRFAGTLMIALGATVIAAFGSAFAALGLLAAFSLALLAGVAVMFSGFLRATRRSSPGQRSGATPDRLFRGKP
jgi:drug/metabolite transporter (DMT)-like permease